MQLYVQANLLRGGCGRCGLRLGGRRIHHGWGYVGPGWRTRRGGGQWAVGVWAHRNESALCILEPSDSFLPVHTSYPVTASSFERTFLLMRHLRYLLSAPLPINRYEYISPQTAPAYNSNISSTLLKLSMTPHPIPFPFPRANETKSETKNK